MTLPSNPDELNKLLLERPGDDVFAKIRHLFPDIQTKSNVLKGEIIALILDDLAIDHALARALDDVGALLEYQAQNEGIERPKFNGQSLIRDVERLSKVKFCLAFGNMLDLPEEIVEQVVKAEIERLWYDPGHATKAKTEQPILRLPDEVTSVLKDVARGLSRKRNDGHQRTASEPSQRNPRTTSFKSKGKDK